MRHLTFAAVLLVGSVAVAQTTITPPSNKYTPAQDVELGRQAAQEVRQKLPILDDDAVSSYVEGLGHRLVAVIPAELQHPEFRYTFEAVNVREINAFALPGGPMFVNRGMIDAARTEGEVVGVMAHELSHVILRHGTAQASKATPYEVGSVLGQIAGAVIGGGWGQVVSGVSQFGFGTAFLRFSREFEKQADLEGTHLMAAAGYDPRDMANVFKTIEERSGPGGPQWLSDHPNPGNRYEYINQEAERLRVGNPVRDTRAFAQVQAHLKTLPAAPSTEEASRTGRRPTGTGGRSIPTGGVAPPSSSYQTYNEGDLFRVSVPANWREVPNNTTVMFAPDGAFNNQGVFTHGVEIGVSRNETHDLSRATEELVASLAQSNPNLNRTSDYERKTVSGRPALHAILANRSATGQRENIELYALQLKDGNLLYLLGVAPQDVFGSYRGAFDHVVRSLDVRD
jgi:Zn-dependent protease with chaperone function